MKLFDEFAYIVFPAYGGAFQDMEPRIAEWDQVFEGNYHFLYGFHGGGILSVPLSIPEQTRYRLATSDCNPKGVYGMVLGNASGERLTGLLSCAQEDRPPAFAVKTGLADRVPNPTVKVTPEHFESLGDGRMLLVVPKSTKRMLAQIELLPQWFAEFGVTLSSDSVDTRERLKGVAVNWFADPHRPMFSFAMSGGVANAAWQTAVTYYIAEYWDTRVRGLDSMHILTNIDGKPSFRRNWTSNK
ncbi:hypothetical protein [Stieleria varia]|uniref:Uncharacterized protein n=1 Tax=Stieleria varia TaxID=2528005 RepID=A0A5C6B818_9BACT|nr:hypothetical protein [Stieleria varia]TWU07571.1 hypothetical protein Pla52n_01440 [Stieleria varia]